jgi:hypothetical protein
MRRTTIALDDDIFRDLKQQAARDGVTLGSLVNRLLRRGLRAPPTGQFRFHLTTVEGPLREGIDLEDKDALLDLMESGR